MESMSQLFEDGARRLLVKRAEEVRREIQQCKLRIKAEQRSINMWNAELLELDKEFKKLGGWKDESDT